MLDFDSVTIYHSLLNNQSYYTEGVYILQGLALNTDNSFKSFFKKFNIEFETCPKGVPS